MKTNQLYLLAGLLLALLTTLPNAARAQVKIGNNYTTIGTNSNLEVESAGGQKVIVNKADGSVIIQNAPTSTTNTFLLTTDANGLVSKQLPSSQTLPPVILGTLGNPGVTISRASGTVYTGSSITLPAKSKYIVNVSMTLGGTGSAMTNTNAILLRTYFADSPTTFALSPDIIGANQIDGMFSSGIYLFMLGAMILQNSTNAPKTYYYYAQIGSNPAETSSTQSLSNFGGNSWGTNLIYAIPVN